MTTPLLDVEAVVAHCTDSPDTLDVGAKEIDQWHKQQGWAGIGYHWVVRRSGALEPGRAEDVVGAHCLGYNFKSIGIVWVGRDKPAAAQYTAYVAKIADICSRYNLKAENVYGHRELNAGRTCPNLDCDRLRADVAAALAGTA